MRIKSYSSSRERLRRFMNPEPRDESGERIEFEARPSGWAFGELFRLVSEETGATILYDTHNAIIKGKKVSFTGTQRVARDESLGWLQDVCSTHGLVLIPHSVPKRNAWFAVDQANPQTSTRPTFIAEDDLPDYVGRSGLYIVSVLTVPDGIEPGRVRQALSQLSTKTAGLGRINDVGEGISLIVADFAHIVATMRRTLDEMAVRRWEHAQGR